MRERMILPHVISE